jgi:ATP-citrate lyase beta-subunit
VAEATKTVSELAVAKLDLNTPASLKYRIINPDGAIWMLLSGGGASLVLADEIADLGMGKQLANYGEYSGNPSREDTYLYTKTLLQDLLKSFSVKKVLIIAGGVANFTDVKKTFLGVIDALEEVKVALKKQQVKVFVRRGGPNQEAGLKLMRYFLEKAGILGAVWGPEEELTKPIQNLELRIKN